MVEITDPDKICYDTLEVIITMWMNRVVEQVYPKIRQMYPFWPDPDDDVIPGELLYTLKCKREVKKQASARRRSIPAPIKLEPKEVPVKTKRKAKYTGKYDDVSLELMSTAKETPKPQVATKKGPKSSTSAVSVAKVPVKRKVEESPAKQRPKKVKRSTLSESSSSEDEEQTKTDNDKFLKLLEMEEIPEVRNIVEAPPVNNLTLLKNIFKDGKGFDASMEKFSKIQKAAEVRKAPLALKNVPKAPPKLAILIDPMESDPTVRAGKKKKKVDPNSREHLGGIFEKSCEEFLNKQIPQKEPPKMVPREQRFLPQIEIRQDIREDWINFGHDSDEEIQVPKRTKIRPLADSDSDEDTPNVQQSFFDPDHERDEEDNNLKSSATKEKEKKISAHDSGTSSPEMAIEYDDGNFIDIDGNDNLDDLIDDDEPASNIQEKKKQQPTIVCEIDDTHIKFAVNKPQELPIDPPLRLPPMRIINTPLELPDDYPDHGRRAYEPPNEEIRPARPPPALEDVCGVDPATDELLRFFFDSACPAWLKFKCFNDQCARSHTLSDCKRLYGKISNLNKEVLDKLHAVLLEFSRLFKEYCGPFAFLYALRNDTESLIDLVHQCGTHARLYGCYRVIGFQMKQSKRFNEISAVEFVLNHKDVPDVDGMRDSIIILILDVAGPYYARFCGYISEALSYHKISLATFKRVLKACNEIQAQSLPFMCMNYMLTLQEKDFKEVGDALIGPFLREQFKFCKIYNQNLAEGKLLQLGTKIQNTGKVIMREMQAEEEAKEAAKMAEDKENSVIPAGHYVDRTF